MKIYHVKNPCVVCCIAKKPLIFCLFYTFFFILTLQFERIFLKLCVLSEFRLDEISPGRHQWKYGKYVSLQWKIFVYSENTEYENTHFISSIFFYTSFINL
jgi:hypothetical protein